MSDDLAPTGEDTATGAESQTGTEATEEQQPSFDDRLNERLAEITGSIPNLVSQAVGESLSQWQQSQEPADDDEEFGLEPGDDGFEEQELQRFLQQQIDEGVQRQLAPIQQQQQLDQRNGAWEKLTESFPDLADQAKASPFVQEAFDLVGGDDSFVNSPRFVALVERVYKAAKADERARQETPADGRTTSLESQGGAAPQESQEESLDDRLAKLAQQTSSL